jgi:hypothetical protein
MLVSICNSEGPFPKSSTHRIQERDPIGSIGIHKLAVDEILHLGLHNIK